MKENINCDTLSVYNDLRKSGMSEEQAQQMTRILNSHYKKVEDKIMNKFKEANKEVLNAISRLDRDVQSLKGNKWDRLTLLAGFVTIAVSIYFGLHH